MSKTLGASFGACGDSSLRGVDPVMIREISPVNSGVVLGSCFAINVEDYTVEVFIVGTRADQMLRVLCGRVRHRL